MKIKFVNSGNGRTPNPELGVKMLKLIEDLGVIKPNDTAKYKKSYGIYECSCGNTFRVSTSAVKSGRIANCMECRNTVPLKDVNRVISDCQETHDYRYTYDNFVYKGRHAEATITCKTHGDFDQVVGNHLAGAGCPTCAQNLRSIILRQSRQDPAVLYYVYLSELKMWKLGVTVQSIATRFNGEIYDYEVLWYKDYNTAQEAYHMEGYILATFQSIRYKGPALLIRKGSTELLTQNILEYLTPSVETSEST